MKFKIQWKLMLSYLTLVLLIGSILYGYLTHTLEKNLMSEVRENLLNETRLARSMSSREIAVMERDAPSLARSVGREIKARVSIISSKGAVMGDSEMTDANIRGLENHSDRPEFRQAMAGGTGTATRYSSTLGTNMLYIAMPFRTMNNETGVVRLALPLSRIEAAIASLHTVIGASLLVAVLFSVLLSYILSSITSRPLRNMASTATLIGKGNLTSRIRVTSSDEIGDLASVMNVMTERMENQLERISAERNRLDTILRGMGEGVIVTDSHGTVTLANPAFQALFSTGDEIVGTSLIEITRQPMLNQALTKVLSTRHEIIDEITVDAHETKHLMTHWVPLLEDGNLFGAVAVFHDITDLRKIEKVRKDFVANVSHELRTPVSVIKGYAETILSEGKALPPEKTAQFAGIIHSHAERLANLINDLLTISRIESGVTDFRLEPVDIDPLVRRVVGLLEQKAHSKGITVTVSETLARIPPVNADKDKLEQILINLLDNAVKFTPPDSTVTVSATDLGTLALIHVADTGIGIPSRDIPRIFERFYRVDSARSRELGGTGLGLSIVKHLVQAHGGAVSVESTPGKGSTFSFTLKKA